MASSPVSSPQSLSCDAMDARSLLAVSTAAMAWFSVLISLYSFLDSSGCCRPRRLDMVKRCRCDCLDSVPVEPARLRERTESERFLKVFVSERLGSSFSCAYMVAVYEVCFCVLVV